MKILSCKEVSQLGGHHTTSGWQIWSQGSGSSICVPRHSAISSPTWNKDFLLCESMLTLTRDLRCRCFVAHLLGFPHYWLASGLTHHRKIIHSWLQTQPTGPNGIQRDKLWMKWDVTCTSIQRLPCCRTPITIQNPVLPYTSDSAQDRRQNSIQQRPSTAPEPCRWGAKFPFACWGNSQLMSPFYWRN